MADKRFSSWEEDDKILIFSPPCNILYLSYDDDEDDEDDDDDDD